MLLCGCFQWHYERNRLIILFENTWPLRCLYFIHKPYKIGDVANFNGCLVFVHSRGYYSMSLSACNCIFFSNRWEIVFRLALTSSSCFRRLSFASLAARDEGMIGFKL